MVGQEYRIRDQRKNSKLLSLINNTGYLMNKITLNLLLLYHSTVRNCTISKSASCMDVPWASHAKSAKRAPKKLFTEGYSRLHAFNADSTVNFESAFDHPLKILIQLLFCSRVLDLFWTPCTTSPCNKVVFDDVP